ncbi:MAG: hypothetical protein B7X04_01995 [Parcubacteria group bacterium 21-54-25]|nr:MAG: hypothetical protein B7X04_01995 [Parcubacteria group bacterium 21-54-25]HQU07655.1 DUF167 domain-containing protein [Candidatus Paceibacterota bacterium]
MHLRVIVTANARKERIETMENGSLRVFVREPSTENRANVRVRNIIAAHVGVPFAQVRIMTGHHRRSKLIAVTSI